MWYDDAVQVFWTGVDHVKSDQMRVLLFGLSVIILVWVCVYTFYAGRQLKKARARGEAMTRKERAHWLKKHRADVLVHAFLEEHTAGRMTTEEVNDTMRLFGGIAKNSDLRTRKMSTNSRGIWGLEEIVKPTKNMKPVQDHIDAVKNGIIRRLSSFKFFVKAYKPGNIPGPKPGEKAPIIAAEAAPDKPKGRDLLGRRKTA